MGFEISANRFSINSGSGLLTYFLKSVGVVPKKEAEVENPGENFSEVLFVPIDAKLERAGIKIILLEVHQEL